MRKCATSLSSGMMALRAGARVTPSSTRLYSSQKPITATLFPGDGAWTLARFGHSRNAPMCALVCVCRNFVRSPFC